MSAGGIPYIGSKISLISKSDIRYEGTLYTIDTKESTVALAGVRSFGTEGRRKDGEQIPASGEVYDYIIFRGSDIKDLHVAEPPPGPAATRPPNDPAIIGTHLPPQQSAQVQQPQQQYPPSFGQFAPSPYQQFPQQGFSPYAPPPPYLQNPYFAAFQGQPQQQQQQPQQPQQQPQQPSQQQHQQPQQRAPVQHSQALQQQKAVPQPAQQQQVPSIPEVRAVATPVTTLKQTQESQPSPAVIPVTSVHTPGAPLLSQPPAHAGGGVLPSPALVPHPQQHQQYQQRRQQQGQQQPRTQPSSYANAARNSGHGYQQPQQLQGQQPQQNGAAGAPSIVQSSGTRGNGHGYQNTRTTSNGRRGYPQGQLRAAPSAATVTKMMEEFNFEESNSKFEKEKILAELAVESDKKPVAYEKTSFFDNISCEATERGAGKPQSSEQRKLDQETFGTANAHRHHGYGGHGHHRGRGGQGGGQRRYQQGNQGSQQQGYGQQGVQQRQGQAQQGQGVFRPVSNQTNQRPS